MEEHQVWYRVGKRDAVAETFMAIRSKGSERAVLIQLASQLLKADEENPNPHAKWYLANHHIE